MSEGLTIDDYRRAMISVNRNIRLIDVAMHGEDGAAKQASGCDLITSARLMRETIDRQADQIQALQDPWVRIEDIPEEWKDGRPLLFSGQNPYAGRTEYDEEWYSSWDKIKTEVAERDIVDLYYICQELDFDGSERQVNFVALPPSPPTERKGGA